MNKDVAHFVERHRNLQRMETDDPFQSALIRDALKQSADELRAHDICQCNRCGTMEHINLLDGAPSAEALAKAGGNAENADFDQLVCIACYGPGWECNGHEQIAESVEPLYRPLYETWLANDHVKAALMARQLLSLEQLKHHKRLYAVAERICKKLEHPTASVTHYDQTDLRAALDTINMRRLEWKPDEEKNAPPADTKSYITTTQGGAGWFAVCLWWNPEGFWEPWQTGCGRYATEAEAEQEGRGWAEADQLEFRATAKAD